MILRFKWLALLLAIAGYCYGQEPERPNILLIISDDLNQMGMGTMIDSTLHTPHIDELVAASAVFTNAHSNVAGCGPSRASMFSGVLPQTSGHSGYSMSNNSWLDNPVLSPTTSVFKQFLDDGYEVYGSGKVYHAYRLREEDFTEFYSVPNQGPFASDKLNHSDMPNSFEEFGLSFARLENIPSYPEYTGWQNRDGTPFFFESDENRDLMGDEQTVEWCKALLESYVADSSGNPFFLSAGLFNPHEPFHVPEKYWDLYDTATFNFDYLQPDTAIPILTAVTNRYNSNSNKAYDLMEEESPTYDPHFYLRQFIHGYYASVSFVDDQVGALLDILEENGLAENTIVIFTSDHGFHLGSKNSVAKSTLWNDATAIPFVIRMPGQSPQIISEPISLIDLYPTLLEYGNVPSPESHELEGTPVQSIISGEELGSALVYGVTREFLELGEPNKVEHSHHGLMLGKYKYIYYSSGEDELYNIKTDFRETNDLSENVQYQGMRNRMYRALRDKIGYIRPPMPLYECLYYGDFSQELNGWGPSEPNANFMLSEGTDDLPNRHLILSGNSTASISSPNITFRQTGMHTLQFEGYSDSGAGEINLRISNKGNQILDTTVTILSNNDVYFLPIPVSNPLPAFGDLKILMQSASSFNIHLDNVYLRNNELLEEALFPCFAAETMQTDVPLSQLQIRQFEILKNQSPVPCESVSGSAPQLWQKFMPVDESGIFAANIFGFDPVLEIYAECTAQDDPVNCINENENRAESIYLSGLAPGHTYYARLSSAKDLPAFNEQIASIQSLFINAKPAKISGSLVQVKNANDSFELVDQPAFDYLISEVEFLFKEKNSGQLYSYVLPFEQSLSYPISEFEELPVGKIYGVSVTYKINTIDAEIPYGPKIAFYYQDAPPSSVDFVLSPNPISDGGEILQLHFNKIVSDGGTVSIYDLAGRLVHQEITTVQSQKLTVSLDSELAKGTYLVVYAEKYLRFSSELLFLH